MKSIVVCLAAAIASLLSVADALAEPQPPRVHRFVSSAESYEGNAFLVDAGEGWVLFDSMMLRRDVMPLVAVIKASGKPLLGVLVSHSHLDHTGGLSPLREALGDVPVYATEATRSSLLREHEQALKTGWIGVFGEEFDRRLTVPDKTLISGEALQLGGLSIRALDVGAVDTDNNTIFVVDGAGVAFVGDALVSSYAVYVGEGRTGAMLESMGRVEKALSGVSRVYPGHGGAMEPSRLIADNRRQIDAMRAATRRALDQSQPRAPGEMPGKAAIDTMVSTFGDILRAYSFYGIPSTQFIAGYLVPGVVREMLIEERAGVGAQNTNSP